MKIYNRDLRHGTVKLGIENLDDLWYLSNIIAPGDLVKAKTERRLKAKDDMQRAQKSERVTITIALRVEKADFSLEADSLRINGTIVEGREDLVPMGSYHTINVEKDTQLTIIKDRWTGFDLQRLKDAETSSLRPKLLIAVIDDGDAAIGLARESKIEHFDLSKLIGGKYDTKGRQDRKKEFYKDIADAIDSILKKENVSTVILAGAGFEKENFHSFLCESRPETAKACVVENIGSHGRAGINEVMKRAKVKKIDEEVNAARDVRMVHQLLEEIGKDSGLAAYGISDVAGAMNMGAIETLIVCDDYFMKNRSEAESIMQGARGAKGAVHIVNHVGEAGEQLSSLGGIAAILRFKTR